MTGFEGHFEDHIAHEMREECLLEEIETLKEKNRELMGVIEAAREELRKDCIFVEVLDTAFDELEKK